MEINGSYELYNLLDEKFGDRLDVDPIETLGGAIPGKLDGYIFNITYRKDNYLLISTEKEGKHIIAEMLPIFKMVMDEPPIIEYNMIRKKNNKELIMPTLEFDAKNPEERIKDIVNGRALSNSTSISDIKILYGENDLEYYIETLEEREEKEKSAKIYGIYPGSIKNVEEVNHANELDLFLMIDALGGYIYHMKRLINHGEDIDISEEEYALEYMVYQTRKFGVEFEKPSIGSHIRPTESYQAWYNFYASHFKLFSTYEFEIFKKLKDEGKDIEHFLPVGNWKDNLNKNKTL